VFPEVNVLKSVIDRFVVLFRLLNQI